MKDSTELSSTRKIRMFAPLIICMIVMVWVIYAIVNMPADLIFLIFIICCVWAYIKDRMDDLEVAKSKYKKQNP